MTPPDSGGGDMAERYALRDELRAIVERKT